MKPDQVLAALHQFESSRVACKPEPAVTPRLTMDCPPKDRENNLIERLDHGVFIRRVDGAWTHTVAQFEDALDYAQLSGSSIDASHSHPVIDNHTGSYDGATSVDASCNQRDLKQTRQLVLVLNGRPWVYNAALVGEAHVASNQDVVGNSLSENFYTQDIRHDLFCLPLDVRVDKCNMVIRTDNIAKSRQALFNSLYLDFVRYSIAQVLEFLIGSCRWY